MKVLLSLSHHPGNSLRALHAAMSAIPCFQSGPGLGQQ